MQTRFSCLLCGLGVRFLLIDVLPPVLDLNNVKILFNYGLRTDMYVAGALIETAIFTAFKRCVRGGGTQRN